MKKILTFVLVLILLGAAIVGVKYLGTMQKQSNAPHAPNPSIPPSALEILVDAAVWYPSAPWSKPAIGRSPGSYYGNIDGQSITATVTSQTASIPHFEDVHALQAKGFVSDPNLAADGPGSSFWGYKKNVNGNQQIILFSYETKPTSNKPNEPLQFNCPCKVQATAFVSNIWQGSPMISM